MQYHDFRLDRYEVSEGGRAISLHLIFDYPATTIERSTIRFVGVALYNFTHTGGAIITDIVEVPLAELLAEMGSRVAEWDRLYGVHLWDTGVEKYQASLQARGFKAWRVSSAIGFFGFIIAQNVHQVCA